MAPGAVQHAHGRVAPLLPQTLGRAEAPRCPAARAGEGAQGRRTPIQRSPPARGPLHAHAVPQPPCSAVVPLVALPAHAGAQLPPAAVRLPSQR